MPTFHITGPDGSEYEIEGPEGSTQEQAIAQAQAHAAPSDPGPQGTNFQYNPAHSQAMTDAALRLPTPPPLSVMKNIGMAGGKVLQGLTGSWDDEAAGALSYVRGNGFDKGQEEYTKDRAQFEQESPWISGLSRTAGTLGSLAFPVARAAQGVGMGAKVLNGLATGAAYGAASGLGEGDGTERLMNGVAGGLIGGTIGAAAPVAISAGASLGRVGREIVAPIFSNAAGERIARDNANRQVGRSLALGSHTPAQAAEEVNSRGAMGVPASPADISDAARALTASVAHKPGPGQSAVREAVARKQANMASRVRGHIDATLGDTVDAPAQSSGLIEQARADAKPFYDAAYQTPVTMTAKLREFADSPIGREGLAAGRRDIENTPTSRRNLGSETPSREGHVWDPALQAYRNGDVPVLEAFDGAKRHLDALEFDGANRFLPRVGSNDSRVVGLRRRELLEELDAQSPDYAKARAAYAGPASEATAFNTGLQELPGTVRHTVEDAQSQMRDMTPSQLEQFRLGDRTRLAQGVDGSITGPSQTADATASLGGSNAREAMLSTIHGSENASALQDRLAAERTTHETYRATTGNGARSLPEDLGADGALQSAGHLLMGRPIRASLSMLSAATGGAVGRAGEARRGQIGQIMTTTGPENVNAAMAAVQARIDADAIRDARLSKLSAKIGRFGSTQVVGNSGDESGTFAPTP